MTECPACNSKKVGVADSRKSGDSVRRRRVCPQCGHRWTTFEIPLLQFERFQEFLALAEKVKKP